MSSKLASDGVDIKHSGNFWVLIWEVTFNPNPPGDPSFPLSHMVLYLHEIKTISWFLPYLQSVRFNQFKV